MSICPYPSQPFCFRTFKLQY